MAGSVSVRFAAKEDAAVVLKIYETYIENTTVTFEIEVPAVAAFEERMERITAQFPWLVCVIDGGLQLRCMRWWKSCAPRCFWRRKRK